MSGALPTFLIIGAMKCGTTALHRLLGTHPQIAVSAPKELNFFFGEMPPRPEAADPWATGNYWRGVDWYAGHFTADSPVRGEASPGYTSPSHPGVADRVAAVLPDVRLCYLVRDPIERAVSQYHHHRRDGAEARPLAEALLDPASQYLARSRYHERLVPFLDHVPRRRILVIAMEDLRDDLGATLARVCSFLGVQALRCHGPASNPTRPSTRLPPALHAQLAARLRDDVARLRDLTGHRFAHWSV